MKTNKSDKLNLREGGKEELESTIGFARQAREIRKQVTNKYAPLLLQQTSWLRRFFIRLKRENEIRKRIQPLSSWKDLHTKNQQALC